MSVNEDSQVKLAELLARLIIVEGCFRWEEGYWSRWPAMGETGSLNYRVESVQIDGYAPYSIVDFRRKEMSDRHKLIIELRSGFGDRLVRGEGLHITAQLRTELSDIDDLLPDGDTRLRIERLLLQWRDDPSSLQPEVTDVLRKCQYVTSHLNNDSIDYPTTFQFAHFLFAMEAHRSLVSSVLANVETYINNHYAPEYVEEIRKDRTLFEIALIPVSDVFATCLSDVVKVFRERKGIIRVRSLDENLSSQILEVIRLALGLTQSEHYWNIRILFTGEIGGSIENAKPWYNRDHRRNDLSHKVSQASKAKKPGFLIYAQRAEALRDTLNKIGENLFDIHSIDE